MQKRKHETLIEGSTRDWAEEVRNAISAVQAVHAAAAVCAKELQEKTEVMVERACEAMGCVLKFQQANAMVRHISEELIKYERAFEDAERECSETGEEFKVAKKETKRLYAAANETSPLTEELTEMFAELTDDLDTLVAEIEERQAQADNISRDNHIADRYEKLKRDIKERAKALKRKERGAAECLDEETRLKASWLKPIKDMVHKISVKFSELFRKIHEAGYKCAGEVKLLENATSYGEYGIGIRVKFRENQQMQLLSGVSQSGGERSLSTFT